MFPRPVRERIEGEGLITARGSFRARFKILLSTSCPCVILERSEESRLSLASRFRASEGVYRHWHRKTALDLLISLL
jgi:hypothetical protein